MATLLRTLLLARETMLVAVLAALVVFFSATTEGFLDLYGLLEQTRYWVVPGLLAVPMTFIIATSGIDLSVGSIMALAGVVLGMLHVEYEWPVWQAATAGIGVAFAAGAVNGGVSSYLGIPPLVVTLATMTLFRGLAMGLSQAEAFGGYPEGFAWISQGDLFEITYGDGDIAGFPVPVAALLGVTALGAVLMRYSWVGRYTECIGENETAARFAAIEVRRLKFALYTACGLVAGLAACFNVTLYDTAKPDAGSGMELEAIACVVVGGTRISGGQGSVLGTLLGLCIIGILRYGLVLYGLQSETVIIVVGVLLIVTAVFNEWMARRQGARA